MLNLYYTYLHRKQSDNEVFYVGKGKGVRAHSPHNRSQRWSRCAAKHGYKVEVLAHWATEQEALEHERFLIKCFREMGIDLCNHTDGGEGVSGLKHTEEAKAKMSAAKAGRKQRPEVVEARASKMRGRVQSDEVRALRSQVNQREDVRAKISASMKKHKRSPEHEAKLREIFASDEFRKKISLSSTGRKKSPEHAAKNFKPVVCLNNGMTFDSLKSAVAWMEKQGVGPVRSNYISMVLTGQRKSVRGYCWAYADATAPASDLAPSITML